MLTQSRKAAAPLLFGTEKSMLIKKTTPPIVQSKIGGRTKDIEKERAIEGEVPIK